MDKARYSDMRLCALKVRTELDNFEALASKQHIRTAILNPIKNRLESAPLRAYYISKVFAYLQSCPDYHKPATFSNSELESLFTQKIPFIYEVIITIQYLHNQILDGKCGVISGKRINDNLLNGNLLKDLLYDYIQAEFEAPLALHITQNVRKVFRLVDLGQEIEKKWNIYDHFQSGISQKTQTPPNLDAIANLEDIATFCQKLQDDLPPGHWSFARIYLQRIYLTCAALFKLATELMLELTAYKGSEHDHLLQFAGCYGIMRQLVNDNADYIPSFFQLSTKGKSPGDALSDLQNRNVTLPLLFYLTEEKEGCIIQYLQGKRQTIKDQEAEVFEAMLDSFALLKSIQNAKILGELAKNCLDSNNPVFPLIADSCNIVQWNKFVFPCYRSEQYKRYKKTPYYKATKAAVKQLQLSHNIQHEEPASGGSPSQGILQEQCVQHSAHQV